MLNTDGIDATEPSTANLIVLQQTATNFSLDENKTKLIEEQKGLKKALSYTYFTCPQDDFRHCLYCYKPFDSRSFAKNGEWILS